MSGRARGTLGEAALYAGTGRSVDPHGEPDTLKHFEELALEGGAHEVTRFTEYEINQVILDNKPKTVELRLLTSLADTAAGARPGDVFELGRHRVICGDARDPAVLARLIGAEHARLLLTDEPYNVPIRGYVTGGERRDFPMASGEMTEAEFQMFNSE